MAKQVEPAAEIGGREIEVRDEAVGRSLPAFLPGHFEPLDGLRQLLPLVVVQNRDGAEPASAGEVGMDLDGGSYMPPPKGGLGGPGVS